MDYFAQSFGFKVRKILRYFLLYGFNRTYYKILGQLHLRRTYDVLPRRRRSIKKKQFIGLIGCGNHAFTTIGNFLTRRYGRVIAGCMDADINRAASLAEQFNVPIFTTDDEEIIGNEAVKLVYIASNHATHAEYAIAALARGKHVYIEKPPVVSEDQLSRLVLAMQQSSGKIFLGFNRPGSRFGRIIRHYLERERGPGMYNFFIVGHDLHSGHWYHDPGEGGRVLGNLCHWTDFVLRLAGPDVFPIEINPTRAKKPDTDIAVTFTFGDGTIAVLTFSTKGHAFAGVKERFNAQKGNCVLTMKDFRTLHIERRNTRKRWWNVHLDHGHRQNILSAAENVINELPYDRAAHLAHLQNTSRLFLKTREALEQNRKMVLEERVRSEVFV